MFRLTGSLITPRGFHTETVLQSGQVLIVGGEPNDSTNPLGTCELYNPTTGTFSATGNLNVPRLNHTATLLANGTVLITGGQASDGSGGLTETAISELYNPATGTFAETGSLNTARKGHTATLFPNGTILIAGGSGTSGYAATAEIYNSTAGTFTNTGTLNNARAGHTATLLNDGTILIAGGGTYAGNIAVAELYNATAGTFTDTGSLNTASLGHIATILNNGEALIAGGYSGYYTGALARTELYNPTTKLFTAGGNMSTPRALFAASLLGTGNVLLVGGVDNNNDILASADLYNPTASTFSIAGDLNDARTSHTAALLNDGAVLIVGGLDANDYDIGAAETYQGTAVPPSPFSLQITPAVVNMLVGGTQTFTGVDNLGIPRTDTAWTVSNTSIATVTTNPNGTAVVTALAAGQVTLTASAEDVTAQETVSILSQASFTPGSTIWSALPPAGYSVVQLAQAVPSASGPALYSISQSADGTQSIIQALQADGEQLWQTTMPTVLNNAVPDSSGGLIVTTCASGNPLTVLDLNATGEVLWQQAAAELKGFGYICYPPQIAVSAAGVAFIAEPTNAGLPSLTVAYPSGYVESSQFPASTVGTTEVQCCVGRPMVNTDGTTYVEYEVRTTNNNVITSDTLYLYSSITLPIVLSSTTQNEALLPGPIIPDSNGGVFATWTISAPTVLQYPYQIVDVSGGIVGTPYNLPFSPTSVAPFVSPTLVLGENGVAFASGTTTSSTDGVTQVSQIASFNIGSGSTNWTYQAQPNYTLSIIAAADGNGLAAKTTDHNGNDNVVRFDSSGNATFDNWGSTPASGIDFFIAGDSWVGTAGANSYSVFSAPPVELSTSSWFRPAGLLAQAARTDYNVTGFSQTGANQSTITSVLQALAAALPSYSSCNTWLQGGLQEIQNLLNPDSGLGFGNGTVRLGLNDTGAISYTIGAITGSSNSDGTAMPGLPASGIIMTVNDAGAFFNPTAGNNGPPLQSLVQPIYRGNTPQIREEMLLHELAHQVNAAGFQPDGNDPGNVIHVANDTLLLKNCGELIAGPSIKSLSPNSGSVGTSVTIMGAGFGSPQGSGTVVFNANVAATVSSWADNQVVVTVPTGATTGNITVTAPGGQTASKKFTVN
jgi:hypothetical protein